MLPNEELLLALTSGGDFFHVKGVVETMLAALNPALELGSSSRAAAAACSPRSAELWLKGELIGYLGEVSDDGLKRFELRGPTTVAELKVAALMNAARLVPKYAPLPALPATSRDVNLVVDERIRWADVAGTVRRTAASSSKSCSTWRPIAIRSSSDAARRACLMTLTFRKPEGTLTNEEADQLRDQIVAACGSAFGAQLRA